MALIECGECKKSVSDKAASCPSCGNPIAKSNGNYVTTQQTSKSIKVHILASFSIIGLGLFLTHDNPGAGLSLIGIGLIWLIGANMIGWWKHG